MFYPRNCARIPLNVPVMLALVIWLSGYGLHCKFGTLVKQLGAGLGPQRSWHLLVQNRVEICLPRLAFSGLELIPVVCRCPGTCRLQGGWLNGRSSGVRGNRGCVDRRGVLSDGGAPRGTQLPAFLRNLESRWRSLRCASIQMWFTLSRGAPFFGRFEPTLKTYSNRGALLYCVA